MQIELSRTLRISPRRLPGEGSILSFRNFLRFQAMNGFVFQFKIIFSVNHTLPIYETNITVCIGNRRKARKYL